MSRKLIYLALALSVSLGALSTVEAQRYEIHPYAGWFNPGDSDFGNFKGEGIYGLKGNVALTPAFELEGNFGYINHFQLENLTFDPDSRATLFEAAGNITFPWTRFSPFVTGGIGGLRAMIDNDLLDFDNTSPNTVIMNGNRLNNGDWFLMVSYGGGIKGERLWGPVGLRADVRGRTLPNIFGDSMTWLETTGGIIFSWGE
jgi:hypothetical protein